MRITKSIVFSSLIVGALSTTQTDAFARGAPHGHGERPDPRDIKFPDSSALKEIKRPDASKYHTVLNHPEEREASSRSGTSSDLQAKGPEDIKVDDGASVTVGSTGMGVTVADSGYAPVTVGNGAAVSVGGIGQEGVSISAGYAKGAAHEDAVGAAHPESKTQDDKKKYKSAAQCTPSVHNPDGCG